MVGLLFVLPLLRLSIRSPPWLLSPLLRSHLSPRVPESIGRSRQPLGVEFRDSSHNLTMYAPDWPSGRASERIAPWLSVKMLTRLWLPLSRRLGPVQKNLHLGFSE